MDSDMELSLLFVLNSVLLGTGLAMDAFSVSLANGLREPFMSRKRMCTIAGMFSLFQWAMPMIGWICVHTVVSYFTEFERAVPWIALILLLFIGGKMVSEGIGNKTGDEEHVGTGMAALLLQGVATSIDALSVGFTIAGYGLLMAFTASVIIGIVTFVICYAGLVIGKKFGTGFAGRASILGGIILIGIGIEIFVKGMLA